MAKIILTEEQLQKVIKQRIDEQNFLNIPPVNAASLLRTSPYAPKAAPNAAAVAATNASLMKPGESASDYFRNPDGTIKVTDLDPVTVTAKRIKPTAPVSGTTTTTTPQQAPAPTPAAGQQASANPTPTPAPTATTSVGSGPTAPPQPELAPAASKTVSGEQFHDMLIQKGLINGFTDMDGYENRRIVYKGAPLSQEQVTLLTNYLVSKGYGKRFSQVGDKRYGQKYVWVKGGSAPIPSDTAV
jgi:hypothetical protein